MRQGRVVSFDEGRGYGLVADRDSDEEFFFHCTAVADGTRSIEVGTEVVFELRPRLGRWEAWALAPPGRS